MTLHVVGGNPADPFRKSLEEFVQGQNAADVLRDASLAQIAERTRPYDNDIDAAVLRAALLVVGRIIAAQPVRHGGSCAVRCS